MHPVSLPGRLAAALSLVAALLALGGGCTGGSKPTGRVKGEVLVNGKPVPDGEVHFLSKEGAGGRADIDESGKFAFAEPLETGEYRIYVAPHPPGQAGPPGKNPAPKASASPIPQKYRNPETSGLTYIVKEGDQEHKIELKD